MALDNVKNFAKVTVSTGYNAAATSIVLTTGHGAKLPSVSFNAIWWNSTDYTDPSDDPNVEIVRVTAISTDTLTVTRAQEGTSASTKNTAGKTYKMIAGLTAKVINTDLGALMYQLDSVSLGANATSLNSNTFAAFKNLLVVISVVGFDVSDILKVNFNSDTGTNYAYKVNYGAVSSTAQSALKPRGTSGTATAHTIRLEIINLATAPKLVTAFNALANTSANAADDMIGTWNNTTDQITSIQLASNSANNLLSGSSMTIYGWN
jgi:hypothetical protein